jgi:Na+/H+-translocating membrane pyrophosphatase
MLEFALLEGFTFTNTDQYVVNLLKPANAVGIFFGAAMPYLFSALTIRYVK